MLDHFVMIAFDQSLGQEEENLIPVYKSLSGNNTENHRIISCATGDQIFPHNKRGIADILTRSQEHPPHWSLQHEEGSKLLMSPESFT